MTFNVYRHINRINDKSYVGYTRFSIDERWHQHCTDAHKGSRYAFHRAIVKYGPAAFDHVIIEEVETEELAWSREQHWILTLKTTTRDGGYNMTHGGCSRLTVWTDEMREHHRQRTSEGTKRAFRDPVIKQRHLLATRAASNKPENRTANSIAQLEAQNRPEVRLKHSTRNKRLWADPSSGLSKRRKPIQQLTFDGVVVSEFASAHDAARTLGLSQGSISNCARGVSRSAGGFVWRYVCSLT